MSYYSMAKSLTGEVPKTPLSLVQNKILEALGNVYDNYDWSFQTQYGGWLAPGLVLKSGTFTVTPYSTTIIADAAATLALAAYVAPPLITTLQYRDPSKAIYSIVGYDPAGAFPYATLTLDRPWMENTQGPGQPYMIYGAYFPAPVADFRKFIEIRDTQNVRKLNYTEYNQADLARRDPQRTVFSMPKYVVPAGVDNRPGSATPGYPLFELWPGQLSYQPYGFSYRRRGPMLANPSDTLVSPLTEALVMWKAKETLFQFKSAEAEEKSPGSGRGWLLLSKAARDEFEDELNRIRAVDCNLHNDFMNRIDRVDWSSGEPFSTTSGELNVGSYKG